MERPVLRIVVTLAAAAALAAMLSVVFVTPDVTDGDPAGHPEAGERADPDETYDPVEAGEPLPDGWRQLLSRDGIPPIYYPELVAGDEVDWPDDALVLGVEIDGDARAYPISALNRREMVNDVIAGVPVLASW